MLIYINLVPCYRKKWLHGAHIGDLMNAEEVEAYPLIKDMAHFDRHQLKMCVYLGGAEAIPHYPHSWSALRNLCGDLQLNESVWETVLVILGAE